jgi:hypothetical protein
VRSASPRLLRLDAISARRRREHGEANRDQATSLPRETLPVAFENGSSSPAPRSISKSVMVGTLIAAVSSSARRSMTYLALLPVAFGVLGPCCARATTCVPTRPVSFCGGSGVNEPPVAAGNKLALAFAPDGARLGVKPFRL